jgi:hypothetical protein
MGAVRQKRGDQHRSLALRDEFLLDVAIDLFGSEQERVVARQGIETAPLDAAWLALRFSPFHDPLSSPNNDPGELD